MKKFALGLIVGKFSPLHKGHELAIGRGLELCEDFVVLTYSNPEFEKCGRIARERWIREIFPGVKVLALDDQFVRSRGLGTGLPKNEDSDFDHRLFVARVFQCEFGRPPDAVFTSEDYGPGFAAHLTKYFGKTVEHVAIDPARAGVPVSGTDLRGDVHGLRKFLSPAVYRDFVETVCFIGAESTGKSTLAKAAAGRFESVAVEEYGRALWEEKGGKLEFEDMIAIARKHTSEEERARGTAKRYLFVDTSPLTTLFYSHSMFGRANPELERLAERDYDHLFLCQPDFSYVQDGTRAGIEFQKRQHEWYLKELEARKLEYHSLAGSIEARLETIERILGRKSK